MFLGIKLSFCSKFFFCCDALSINEMYYKKRHQEASVICNIYLFATLTEVESMRQKQSKSQRNSYRNNELKAHKRQLSDIKQIVIKSVLTTACIPKEYLRQVFREVKGNLGPSNLAAILFFTIFQYYTSPFCFFYPSFFFFFFPPAICISS